MVYKAARYGEDHYFPVLGLPSEPGLPEYLLYTTHDDDLAPFLPAVYSALELKRGGSYQYLIEDLEGGYRPPLPNDLPSIVAKLPTLHHSIGIWATTTGGSLPTYDARWSDNILEFARASIEGYARRTTSETPREVLRLWDPLIKYYSDRPHPHPTPAGGVHGDLKPSNILVGRTDAAQIKLIDWDGAGFGPPHHDLVALLAAAPHHVVDEALHIYARHDVSLTLAEHRRMYEWHMIQDLLLLTSRAARKEARTVETRMWQLLFACTEAFA